MTSKEMKALVNVVTNMAAQKKTRDKQVAPNVEMVGVKVKDLSNRKYHGGVQLLDVTVENMAEPRPRIRPERPRLFRNRVKSRPRLSK
ncbi:hypothetical protein WR164_01870 [Philodulcilactobacillus myokoensis]|uniref:Uncharacterized protein n=1 Tax=Philodulcilactobacillus myokoensis TaxID=2929573 RepID=A0A9W6ESD0_9LACO|nr:hypothetical protein [Philodulcilactobacillus myokoensis]GLB46208.1 hypothetical protein WR164_01870 [Philodulcilactobacillus myokoensis]